MKIPELFYGKPGQVRSRVRKIAKALVESHDFATFDPGPFLELSEVQGQILVEDSLALSGPQHFHCYFLSDEIAEASPRAERQQNLLDWLMGSLDSEWRFMCTLGGRGAMTLHGRDLSYARRYVDAAVQHWPAMAAERSHFAVSSVLGDILNSWNTFFYALELLGLSRREYMAVPERDPITLSKLLGGRGLP